MAVWPPAFAQRFNLFPDEGTAFFHVDNDEVFFEGFYISLGRRNRNGLTAQEAMAAGHIAAFDIVCFNRNDFTVKKGHHPVERTDKPEVIVGPAHGLWEGQAVENIIQQGRQQDLGFTALCVFDGINVTIPFFKGRDFHTLTAGKALDGFRRVAVCVKGNLEDGPLLSAVISS